MFHTRSYLQRCPGREERFLCGSKDRKAKVKLTGHSLRLQKQERMTDDWHQFYATSSACMRKEWRTNSLLTIPNSLGCYQHGSLLRTPKEPQRTRRQKHGKKALPEICQVTHQWKSSLNHTNAVLICELAVMAQRRATEVAANRSQIISWLGTGSQTQKGC